MAAQCETRDRSYHDKLVAQLSYLVQVLIARFDLTQEEAAAEFAAENLLRLALAGKDRYEKEETLLLRALHKEA